MILLPPHLVKQYQAFCVTSGIKDSERADYLKWLRYFLDFCEKYGVTGDKAERVCLFLNKLVKKGQSEGQRQQAQLAVSLYFEMIGREPLSPSSVTTSYVSEARKPQTALKEGYQPSFCHVRKSDYHEAGYQEKSESPEWDEVIGKLADGIKLRHYSRKTLKTYALWSRQFQRFLKNKPPNELTTDDVKDYLTWLAAALARP